MITHRLKNEIMKRIMFAVVCVVALLSATGCDDNYDAPQSTRNDFYSRYPNAVDVEWERERGHAVAEFDLPGDSYGCEAWYTLGGEWVLTRFKIRYSDLPEAVQTSFEQSYGSQTPIDDVERVERNNAETIYFIEATLVIDGILTDIYLDYDGSGKLLRTAVDYEYYNNIYYYL